MDNNDYNFTREGLDSLKSAYSNDPELREKLANAVSSFKANRTEGNRNDFVSFTAFLKLNEEVAAFLGCSESYERDKEVFISSMKHQSSANPRSTGESMIIDTFIKFADEAYKLTAPGDPNASQQARDM